MHERLCDTVPVRPRVIQLYRLLQRPMRFDMLITQQLRRGDFYGLCDRLSGPMHAHVHASSADHGLRHRLRDELHGDRQSRVHDNVSGDE